MQWNWTTIDKIKKITKLKALSLFKIQQLNYVKIWKYTNYLITGQVIVGLYQLPIKGEAILTVALEGIQTLSLFSHF